MKTLEEFTTNTILTWVYRYGATVKVVEATFQEMSAVPTDDKLGPYFSRKEALQDIKKLVF